MAQPTLDELYAQHGTQRAVYLEDFLAEKGAFLLPCGKCGRLMVSTDKVRKLDRHKVRCAECSGAAAKRE